MAGSDWDASDDDESAPPAVTARPKGRFDDEDLNDEDVKDSWSASEDEAPAKAAASTGPAPPVRQKGITKQKIAEKEAAERARAEARAQEAALDADPAERRRREQAAQLKSDMDNVAGLFGAAVVNGASSNEGLFDVKPRNRADFEQYAVQLAEHLQRAHGANAFYTDFVDHLAKALCSPLKDLDVRKVSSTLSTLANEKQKAAREAAGGKKKKGAAKPGLGLAKAGGYDTRVYDESLDDFGAGSGGGRLGSGTSAYPDEDDFM